MKTNAIVLAAGKGTRMNSRLYKVMHPVCGKPMIQHIVDLLCTLSLDTIAVVIGHGADAVKEQLGESVDYAFQPEQLGTAHAVRMCRELLQDQDGMTIVINGDTPLVKKETLQNLLAHHQRKQAAATVLTTIFADPTGYGRIIRDQHGDVNRIVEEKDATLGQKKVCEISTGIFCFDNRKLFESLKHVHNDNAQGEYYLPDVLQILKEQGCRITAYMTSDPEEGTGVNDRVQLAYMEQLLRRRINERHMRNGVTIIDPASTYIDADVVIERDTVIYPGTLLRGTTRIGEACEIGPHTEVTNSQVDRLAKITFSTVAWSIIHTEATVGPYVNIRPHSEIGRNVNLIAPVTIAEGAYVAAGSTITEHVPSKALAIARERQTNKENYTAKNKLLEVR